MVDISHLYPPTPATVPPDLTKPSSSYRNRVVIVLLCLVAFVIIYLLLTAGSAYGCYWCFAELARDDPKPPPAPTYTQQRNPYTGNYRVTYTPPPPKKEKPVLMLIIGGIGSGALFLFLVKGLFKRSRFDPGVRVELTEAEQPLLFAFIRQLCKDTGAPFPHRVFVTPDVNAAVSFQESLLNLVFPSKKNLIIGLGLVNRLNLSEFKAVLAHEFGHFSQNSMKLGSYVYTANRVVADVVYGRDAFDDFLAAAGRIDIRISVFVWTFAAVLWTMRKGLHFMFRGINFAHTALSRQMEYNADLVAASVTGSDALVFALGRLDLAGDALGQAWTDLTAAADHNRYSRDLYFHQTKAAEYIKARRNKPQLGEVPPLPENPNETVQVFKPEDTSVPKMWATHPSNHDREVSIKTRYFRGPIDERSAWELFRDAATLKEKITHQIYLMARKTEPGKLEEPEVIQEFIDAEHAEMTYHPRYQGLYENRYIKPGDLAELCTTFGLAQFENRARLAEVHASLFDDELKARMESHKARQEEINKLGPMAHGAVELTGKDFEHRGRRYRLTDAQRLLKEVEQELDKDFEWMHALDQKVFRVHYAMVLQLGEAERLELEDWYKFHLAVQNIHMMLAAYSRNVQQTLAAISGQRQLSQADFQHALGVMREAVETLRSQLEAAHTLRLPPLKNMTAGEPLGPFLLSSPVMRNIGPDAQTLDGQWIQQYMNQTGEVMDKLARVLFKSLGGLLALQERIAEKWAAQPPLPAEPVPEPIPETAAEPAGPPDETGNAAPPAPEM